MELNLSNEILRLIQKSQTTVMKLYHFVNGEESMPTPQEFNKFKDGLIASIKRKKEKALELFPIIKYFESKRMTEEDYQYDNVLFTVPEDEKILIASPLEVLEEMPEKKDYNLHIKWDLTTLEERESKVFRAAENYFNIIKNDENLRRFVKYIGTSTEKNWELLVRERELFLENVPQEVFALYQSGDLNSLLPIEIMQLDDEDLEMVFLKNFIETKLLTYQLWGIEREIFEEWVLHNKDTGDMGPIFVCLDTSGSMRGLTETVAKAVTMFVINELENANKGIVYVPFSMDARLYDLNDSRNKLKKAKLQLKKSYYGGTNIDSLLDLIDSQIDKIKYKKANILIISDFLFKNINKKTVDKIKSIKERGHKFHGLNISDKKYKNTIVDVLNSYWTYTYNWKGTYENNEDELINQLSGNTELSSAIIETVQTFGIIKKMKDNDFIPKTKEQLDEEDSLKKQDENILNSTDRKSVV